jgi:hypothetical protein
MVTIYGSFPSIVFGLCRGTVEVALQGSYTVVVVDGGASNYNGSLHVAINRTYIMELVECTLVTMTVVLQHWAVQPDGSVLASMSVTPLADSAGLPSESIQGQLEAVNTNNITASGTLELVVIKVTRHPGRLTFASAGTICPPRNLFSCLACTSATCPSSFCDASVLVCLLVCSFVWSACGNHQCEIGEPCTTSNCTGGTQCKEDCPIIASAVACPSVRGQVCLPCTLTTIISALIHTTCISATQSPPCAL